MRHVVIADADGSLNRGRSVVDVIITEAIRRGLHSYLSGRKKDQMTKSS